MTAKEVCEAWARRNGVPVRSVAEEGRKFFEASPTGELSHVFAAMEILEREGLIKP